MPLWILMLWDCVRIRCPDDDYQELTLFMTRHAKKQGIEELMAWGSILQLYSCFRFQSSEISVWWHLKMFIWSAKTRCHNCELMSWRLAVIASGKQFKACAWVQRRRRCKQFGLFVKTYLNVKLVAGAILLSADLTAIALVKCCQENLTNILSWRI